MLIALPASIAAQSFGLRFAASIAIWTGIIMLLQTWVELFVALMRRFGVVHKTIKDPSVPRWQMLLADFPGYAGWAMGVAFFQAWVNPRVSDYSYDFNPWQQLWFQLLYLFVYDTYFYWVHRGCHINKGLYKAVHLYHHISSVVLGASTTGWITVQEGILLQGIPFGVLAWLAHAYFKNWWFFAVPFYTAVTSFIIGHTGIDLSMKEPEHVFFLAMNPMGLALTGICNLIEPAHHADHHLDPRVNFGLVYTYWDDWMGTNSEKHAPVGVFVMALNVLYWSGWNVVEYLIAANPPMFVLGYIVSYILTPVSISTTILSNLTLHNYWSRWSVWDTARDEYHVTFSEEGETGRLCHGPCQLSPAACC